MKNVMQTTVAAAVAVAMLTAGFARGQEMALAEGGAGVAHMPDSAAAVRPADAPPPAITTTPITATRGSLFRAGAMAPVPIGADGQPIGPAPVSFTAVSAPMPRKFKKNDLITIIVQEDSTYSSNAQTQSQKQQDFDLALQNWIQLHTSDNGVPKTASVGSSGTLPEAKFKYDNNRQNQATDARTDSFSVRISATVVDVKPNGTVVVEGVKQVTVDREVQNFRISGICRAEDVTPDNTVLSTQLANLTVSKQTKGEVKDGVQRGWLNGIIDKISPF